MSVKFELKPGDKPTKKQLERIENAAKHPIVADDDCPELTGEEIEKMRTAYLKKKEERKKQVISIRVSKETVEKAKMLGEGYTSVLGRVIENVVNEPDILKKYL